MNQVISVTSRAMVLLYNINDPIMVPFWLCNKSVHLIVDHFSQYVCTLIPNNLLDLWVYILCWCFITCIYTHGSPSTGVQCVYVWINFITI